MSIKNGKSNTFAKALITIVGVFFILWAINDVALALIGKTAKVTDIYTSRIGSRESEQPTDKEYKWSVSWTFEVDGKEYEGRATTRGSAVSVKHGNTVYYYPFLPQMNSIYAKDNAGIWTVVQVGIGVILILAVNMKRKNKARPTTKTVKQAEDGLDDYDDSVEEIFHND